MTASRCPRPATPLVVVQEPRRPARIDEGRAAVGVDHVREDDEGQEEGEGERVALGDEVDRAR